jgi:hypothetical protein
MVGLIKNLLPAGPRSVRVWRGPFRGAQLVLDPRSSLRKLLGVYEHELNTWIERSLGKVSRVVDVGANDGYFTFGSAAAFRRLSRAGAVIAFEPGAESVKQLRESLRLQPPGVKVELLQKFVGRAVTDDCVTLDAFVKERGVSMEPKNTLVKIDVEGAEMDVLSGALSWLNPSNHFLIEVHKESLLSEITELFSSHGLSLDLVEQRPLKFFGAETRSAENWWLVSQLRA